MGGRASQYVGVEEWLPAQGREVTVVVVTKKP